MNKNLLKFILVTNFFTITLQALNSYGISELQLPDNRSSFKEHREVFLQRISEEMCDENTPSHQKPKPTVQAIFDFVANLQKYLDDLKINQLISQKSVDLARLALVDATTAQKLISKSTPAGTLEDLRHMIHKIDIQIQKLQEYLDAIALQPINKLYLELEKENSTISE